MKNSSLYPIKALIAAFAVASASLLNNAKADVNIVQNGDFTQGTNNLADWTYTGGSGAFVGGISNYNGFWWVIPTDGSTTDAFLTQDIPTVPGQEYNASFVVTNQGGPANDLTITSGTTTLLSLTNADSFSPTTYSGEFVANSSSTIFEIAGRQIPSRWGVTDIVVSESVVPEPSTYALLGVGAVGFGLLRRRQLKAHTNG